MLDWVAPGLALGIAIGRVGDLIVADHLGKPTRFALGFVCPNADTASPCAAPVGQAVHQPALCYLLAAAVILALLLAIRSRRRTYALSTWWLVARRRTPGRKHDEPERVSLGSEQGAAP